MKKILLIKIYIFHLLVLTLLSACGGGEGGGDSVVASKIADDGSSSSVTTLSGVVADGYLRNAKVFLDRNGNRVYDNGEPYTQSATGGGFSLEVNPGEGELYPVVAQVIADQTIDEDTGAVVTNDYVLESMPVNWDLFLL